MAHSDNTGGAGDAMIRIGTGPDEIPLSDAELESLLTSLRSDLGDDDFAEMMGQLTSEETASKQSEQKAFKSFEHWAQAQPAFRELLMARSVTDVARGVFNFVRAMLGMSVPDADRATRD